MSEQRLKHTIHDHLGHSTAKRGHAVSISYTVYVYMQKMKQRVFVWKKTLNPIDLPNSVSSVAVGGQREQAHERKYQNRNLNPSRQCASPGGEKKLVSNY